MRADTNIRRGLRASTEPATPSVVRSSPDELFDLRSASFLPNCVGVFACFHSRVDRFRFALYRLRGDAPKDFNDLFVVDVLKLLNFCGDRLRMEHIRDVGEHQS